VKNEAGNAKPLHPDAILVGFVLVDVDLAYFERMAVSIQMTSSSKATPLFPGASSTSGFT